MGFLFQSETHTLVVKMLKEPGLPAEVAKGWKTCLRMMAAEIFGKA